MSEYIQQSFAGGINLLADATRIQSTQYRIGFNLRNRYDILEPVLSSKIDKAIPQGIVQELITFGNYLVIFVSGKAYYRYYTATGWKQIVGFQMSPIAPRLWTVSVPVSITNFYRLAIDPSATTVPVGNVNSGIVINTIAGAAQGDIPGLLVQDNLNQPQFIFLDANGTPTSRITQTFDEWSITFTSDANTTVAPGGDRREYVPVGNSMAWVDGVLWIVSQDYNYLYRSVSGRPLDFVVNVSYEYVTTPWVQVGGGDATTTSYSVGVGGISGIRAMSNDALFVAAANANFMVAKNLTNLAPKEFGEYTFIRTFLFNATCLSDRAIIDSLGDTRFIDLTGVRSFNAIQQQQNEGRNSLFTAMVQAAFTGLVQDARYSAAILYNNYEFYAVQTIFGPAIVVYDTINACWSSFDLDQVGNKRVKILAKIELDIQRLYAITEDNELYTLYIGPGYDTPKIHTISISPNTLKDDRGYTVNSKGEIKLTELRCVFNKITSNVIVNATPYVNNRLSKTQITPKQITYVAPTYPSTELLSDIDTQLSNVLFSFPDCGQGWKTFCLIEWTGNAALTQFSCVFNEVTPMNPLLTQAAK